jgi:hypothetical protein
MTAENSDFEIGHDLLFPTLACSTTLFEANNFGSRYIVVIIYETTILSNEAIL